MISDTLYDARNDIERYERDLRCYAGIRFEIRNVKIVMQSLQCYLDTPPDRDGVYPKYSAALKRLRKEIAALNVEPLMAAVENLKSSWPTPDEVEAAKAQGRRAQ
jgi:hypothetical protein